MKAYVLDASALLAFVEKTRDAIKVNELLKEVLRGHAEISMSAVNYGEVYGIILRKHGADRANWAVNTVRPLPIRMVDATPQRSLRAAEIKSKYKLYQIDSFAAALAIECKATLITSDADFRRLGHSFPTLWLRN
jgi:predicted nucleic acid-binding protein